MNENTEKWAEIIMQNHTRYDLEQAAQIVEDIKADGVKEKMAQAERMIEDSIRMASFPIMNSPKPAKED